MKTAVPLHTSHLSPHLSAKNRSKLDDFYQAARTQFGERVAVDKTKNYCLSSTAPEILRTGMEFLFMNGFFRDLRILIEKNKQSRDPVSRQWSLLYELQLTRQRGEYPAFKLLEQLHLFKTTIPELICLKGFLELHLYYDTNKFDQIGYYLERQAGYMTTVTDPLMAGLLEVRLQEVQAIYYWKRNELIIGRKHAFQALQDNYSPGRKTLIHERLGLSYIYEDYFHSVSHIQEALQTARQFGLQQQEYQIRNQSLPFIGAHFGHPDQLVTEDPGEQAHLAIARKDLEQAKAILHHLPIDTPFQKYYMGLAYQDRNWLLESYNDFIDGSSDYFFSRLPLHALGNLT